MDLGKEQLLAVRRQPEGKKVGISTIRKVCQEVWDTIKQGTIIEWCTKGGVLLQPYSNPQAIVSMSTGKGSLMSNSPFLQAKASSGCAGPSETTCYPARTSWGVSPGCPSLSHMSTKAGKGWVLKCELKRVDWRRGALLAMWRWHAGMGVKSTVIRNAPEGSTTCLLNKAPSLSGTQGGGCHHRLSLHANSASTGTESNSH